MIHHLTRATRHLIFWSLIAAAVGLTGLRLVFSEIQHYKSDLADTIASFVGAPVAIGQLGAKMHGFNPQLVLKEISIAPSIETGLTVNSPSNNAKPALAFQEIRLGINLLEMLTSGDVLSSSKVTLVGTKLTVKRRQDGSIVIVGLQASDEPPLWLLQGRTYEVLQSEIIWLDETGNHRPVLFKGADLAIKNKGDRHRLNVLMKLPQDIGESLKLVMDVRGNVFEPSTVQGRIYINGNAVRLAEFVELLQVPLSGGPNVTGGSGDFEIWSDWQGRLKSMTVSADLDSMTVAHANEPEFTIRKLSARLHWQSLDRPNRAGDAWRLDVDKFKLNGQSDKDGNEEQWPDTVFSVAVQTGADNEPSALALFAPQLDLHELSELALTFAPLPEQAANYLKQAQLKGHLQDISLFIDRQAESFAVNGGFDGLGFTPVDGIPGAENLSGRIKGDEKQGALILTTQAAKLISPDWFREDVPLDKLQGKIKWLKDGNVSTVSAQRLEFVTLSFQSDTKFRIDLQEDGKPVFIDLQSAFDGDHAEQVKQLLPAKIMDEDVVAWLDQAFVSGKINDGGLLVYGNPDDFPFTEAPGIFEAVFNAEHFDLRFDNEWPDITEMNADVRFSQGGLTVNILQGQSAATGKELASGNSSDDDNVVIKQAEVTIPSLDDSTQLLVDGELNAKIDTVLAYMQHTPLRSRVDALLEAIRPQGDTSITLALKLPLLEGAPTEVDGTAHLQEAVLTVKSLALPVRKIRGDLKFDEQGVYSDGIKAIAFGHPIQIKIESSNSQSTVKVTGSATVEDLQAQFDLPWWEIANGETDYRIKLDLPYGEAGSKLYVESMLNGISLDLPGVLAKAKAQDVPLSLLFHLGDSRLTISDITSEPGALLPVRLDYADQLKAALMLDMQSKAFVSGHVLVGKGEAKFSGTTGVQLEINRDRLALQDWLSMAAAHIGSSVVSTPEEQGGASLTINEVKVHSDHAYWKNNEIGAFDLFLQLSGNNWRGKIASPFVTGALQLPAAFDANGRINLDLETLDLSALKKAGAEEASTLPQLSPDKVPLLSIVSRKTLWRSVDLGLLSVDTERVAGGMRFKRVELNGENQKLSMAGDWSILTGVASETNRAKFVSRVQGHLSVPHAGRFLGLLNISKDIAESDATADFNIHWDGAPYRFSLAALHGRVDVNMKNGRILSIEPGFGRVLGMLAVAQWLKRAQLDFSDVYEEGLTFNNITGHFDLASGIASTQDLVIDAVPAKIAINGTTDMVGQTVDYIVNVTPKSAEAVPIAGTIMGKLAALIGRSLTGKDQEGFFFGSQYQVKGKWREAEILPMHKNDGLLQKTWNGLTDFPWIQEE